MLSSPVSARGECADFESSRKLTQEQWRRKLERNEGPTGGVYVRDTETSAVLELFEEVPLLFQALRSVGARLAIASSSAAGDAAHALLEAFSECKWDSDAVAAELTSCCY